MLGPGNPVIIWLRSVFRLWHNSGKLNPLFRDKMANMCSFSLQFVCIQVPDSIEVVRNILSELEADAEDRPETEEDEEGDDEDEMEAEECTCLQVSTKSRAEGSLVVDVHQGVVHRCSKHTAERFPR